MSPRYPLGIQTDTHFDSMARLGHRDIGTLNLYLETRDSELSKDNEEKFTSGDCPGNLIVEIQKPNVYKF